jgi:hypothetical protein
MTLPRRKASRASSWSERRELLAWLSLLREEDRALVDELEEEDEELDELSAATAGKVSAPSSRIAEAIERLIMFAILPEVAPPI